MPDCTIELVDDTGTIRVRYVITLVNTALYQPTDADLVRLARQSAVDDRIVPAQEVETLTPRIHRSATD